MSDNRLNPYVGPRTFKTAEAHLFFGREREAQDLLALVVSEQLLLFYAQSGAGKSSIINTRLIPALQERKFEVLPIGRVGGEVPPDSEVDNVFVYNLITSLDQSGQNPERFARMELADFLPDLVSRDGNRYQYDDSAVEPGADETEYKIWPRVLIIDQFEEILTSNLHAWKQRDNFFEQLSSAMEEDPYLWVLLSMREDYVASLDPYAQYLPGRLRARYYMKRMNYDAAMEAVSGPVQDRRPFAPGVAEKLVDNLSLVRTQIPGGELSYEEGEFVQPVQLQVVCFQLWENLGEEEAAAGKQLQITDSDLKRLAGGDDLAQFVDSALAQFYEEAVVEVAQSMDKPAVAEFELRDWFETKLITKAHTRALVLQGQKSTGDLDNDTVGQLEDRFLLRFESRAGSGWYELVHDRFVDPILQSNASWRETHPLIQVARDWDDTGRPTSKLFQGRLLATAKTEPDAQIGLVQEFLAASQIEESRQERERQLQEEAERSRLKLLRRVIVVISIFAIFAFGAFFFALIRERQADAARAEAVEQRQVAEAESQQRATAQAEAEIQQQIAVNQKAIAEDEAQIRATAEANAVLEQKKAEEALESLTKVKASSLVEQAREYALSSDSKRALLMSVESYKLAQLLDDPAMMLDVQGALLASLESDDNFTQAEPLDRSLNLLQEVPGSGLFRAASSADGKRLAVGGFDGIVTLWDLAGVAPTNHTLDMHAPEAIFALAFSPDGKTLASATGYNHVRPTAGGATSDDDPVHTIILWDVTQDPPAPLVLADGLTSIWSLAFSPDGRTLASGTIDGTVTLWDVAERRPLPTLSGHDGWVYALAFSPVEDQLTLASGGRDGRVILWDLTGSGAISQTLSGHTNWVNDLAFSPDGKTLASVSDDTTLILWEITGSGGQIKATGQHGDEAWSVAFSPDGETVASGSRDQLVRIWDANDGTLLGEPLSLHGQPIGDLAYVQDGALASLSYSSVYLISHPDDFLSGRPRLAFSPDGAILVARGGGGINLWDIAFGTAGHKRTADLALPVADLTFADDGHTLLVAHEDGTISWREVGTNLELGPQSSGERARSIDHAAVSGDGRRLALASGPRVFLLENWAGDAPASQTLSGHTSSVNDVALNDDGSLLASAGEDQSLVLWRLDAEPATRQVLLAHRSPVRSVTFAPSGDRLASAGEDGTVIIWKILSGSAIEERRLFADREGVGTLTALAFNPGGDILAVAGQGGTIGLWNVASGQNLALLRNTHLEDIMAMAFGEQALAAADSFETIVLWPMSPGILARQACTFAERNMTQFEWEADLEDVFGGEEYHETCPAFSVHASVILDRIARGREAAGRLDAGQALDYFSEAFQLDSNQAAALISRPEVELVDVWLEELRQFLHEGNLSQAQGFENVAEEKIAEYGLSPTIDIGRTVEEGEEIWNARKQIEDEDYRQALLTLERVDLESATELRSDLAEAFYELCSFDSAPVDVSQAACSRFKDLVMDVDLPQSITGLIIGNGSAFWRFAGQAGQIVRVEMNERLGDLAPSLTLLGPNLEWLVSSPAGGFDTNALIDAYILPEDGQYTIVAHSLTGSGDYDLALSDLHGAPIEFGETLQGSLENMDIWSFEGQAGQIASIPVELTDELSDIDVSLLSSDGRSLPKIVTPSGFFLRRNTFMLPEDGLYYIVPSSGAEIPQDVYSISLFDEASRQITPDTPVNGDFRDNLIWRFEAQQGQVAGIRMQVAEGNEFNGFLSLFGPDGNLVASSENTGRALTSEIAGTLLPADGTYALIPSVPSGSGGYTLALTTQPVGSIAIGESASGDFAQETNWNFSGEAGKIILARITNAPAGARLRLLGSGGQTIAETSSSVDGATMSLPATVLPVDGSYTLVTDGSGVSRAYTVSLAEADTQPIAFDVPAAGDLAAGTVWTFQGEPGQIVRIFTSDAFSFESPVTLLGPDGNFVTTTDGGLLAGTSLQNFHYGLTEAGAYTIVPNGSESYTLSLAEAVTDTIGFEEPVRGKTDEATVWTFTGEAGQIVSIALEDDNSDLNTFVTLFGPDAQLLADDEDGGEGTNSLISELILPVEGVYTIVPGGGIGDYVLTLTELAGSVRQEPALGESP
jgi:WD40 repeat protein